MSFVSNFFSLFNRGASTPITSLNYIGNEAIPNYDPSCKGYAIETGYAGNTDVFSIVNLIKTKAIDVDLNLVNSNGEIIDNIPEDLMSFLKKPNSRYSFKELNEQIILYYLTTGNAIIEKEKQFGLSGSVDKLTPLHVQHIEIDCMYANRDIVPRYYNYHLSSQDVKLMPEDVIHVKYANPTDYGFHHCFGLSPLQAGFLTLTASNNLFKADASILKNKGASGVFSNESDVILNDSQRENAQQALDSLLAGADKFGKIIQSPVKTKYTQLGMSMADLKILESRLMKKRDLCSLYHVDSSLFNDPANKTFNNRKEATKSLYTDAVLPLVRKVLIDMVWNPVLSTWGDYQLQVDETTIHALQQDNSEKAVQNRSINAIIVNTLNADISDEQKVQTLIYSLEITEDEARIIVGLK